MAVDEQWMRVRRSLEEKLGVEEASFLMDRPPGGWSELVTTRTLDLRFSEFEARLDARFAVIDGRFDAMVHQMTAIEHRLLAEIDRRSADLAWKLIAAVIAGMAVMGAVFGALAAVTGG